MTPFPYFFSLSDRPTYAQTLEVQAAGVNSFLCHTGVLQGGNPRKKAVPDRHGQSDREEVPTRPGNPPRAGPDQTGTQGLTLYGATARGNPGR